jgi:hypothetical protein
MGLAFLQLGPHLFKLALQTTNGAEGGATL